MCACGWPYVYCILHVGAVVLGVCGSGSNEVPVLKFLPKPMPYPVRPCLPRPILILTFVTMPILFYDQSKILM